jgi:hypothetical protein
VLNLPVALFVSTVYFKDAVSNSDRIENNVGFEVFTAVVMKGIIFWDMTPCSLLSANRRLGGTYRLHLQGRRNKFSKKTSKQAGGKQNATCLLAGFLLNLFLRT